MADAVADGLYEWAENIRGKYCLPNQFKIYAALGENREHQSKVKRLTEQLSSIAGGSTVYESATGYWYDDDDGELVKEPVHVIEVGYCIDRSKALEMANAIALYATSANQKSISVNNRGEIFIIPTPMVEASRPWYVSRLSVLKCRPLR